MKVLFFALFLECWIVCNGEENSDSKNATKLVTTENHLFLCILTPNDPKCKNIELKNATFPTPSIPNNESPVRVKRKGGRGGGGFGGFRGASAARVASGARFSAAGKSGTSGSRSGSYGGYGGAGGTYIYAGSGSYHSSGDGNWPHSAFDIIFVVVLLIGSAVFLVCFCSYLSKDQQNERQNEFSPPKRYPTQPKQKVYTFGKKTDSNYKSQNPPPSYDGKEARLI